VLVTVPLTTTKNFMLEKVFIDTSAFIALNDKSDQYFQKASKYLLSEINNLSLTFYTSNLVIAETYTRLLYKTHFRAAQQFLETIAIIDIDVLYSDNELEQSAKYFLTKYANLKISYTDAVSFAIMTKKNIPSAFSFDKHFEIAGFQLKPAE